MKRINILKVIHDIEMYKNKSSLEFKLNIIKHIIPVINNKEKIVTPNNIP
jgi:hypothetical protein